MKSNIAVGIMAVITLILGIVFAVSYIDSGGVDEVIALINSLPVKEEITYEHKDEIMAAFGAYSNLTDSQKARVPNENIQKLNEVHYKIGVVYANYIIGELPDVIESQMVESCLSLFEEARGWVATLSASQVSELGEGVYAQYAERKDNFAVIYAQLLVSRLGTVTIDSNDAIELARMWYDEISVERKSEVTNFAILEFAETRIGVLWAEYYIDLIPYTVTLDCASAIETANSYYEKLTEYQKSQVSNYRKLENAEKAYSDAVFASYVTLSPVSGGVTISSITDKTLSGPFIIPKTYSGSNIVSISASAFSEMTGLTSVTLPDTIKSIGNYAFQRCTSLQTVTMGNGVQTIGENAFDGCTSLSTVSFSSNLITINNYAFKATSLTAVVIPDSVTTINFGAFYDCKSLAALTLGTGLSSIGRDSFRGCTALQEVKYNAVNCNSSVYTSSTENGAFRDTGNGFNLTIGSSVTRMQEYMFAGSSVKAITVLEGITKLTIQGSAFRDCVRLKSVDLSDRVQTLGDNAFDGCTALTSMVLDNILTIGSYTFRGTGFTVVNIPDSATSLGYGAFIDCKVLTSVTLGKKLTSIGRDSFRGCTALQNVVYNAENNSGSVYNSSTENGAFRDTGNGFTLTVGPSVLRIQDYLFAGSGVKTIVFEDGVSPLTVYSSAFRDCVRLTKVTLGSEVQIISDAVFDGCTALATLVFSSGLKTISNYAFRGTAFTSLTIPDSVATIGYAAFQNCKLLTSLTLGKGLTSIGRDSFNGCTALQSVVFNSANNIGSVYNSSTDNGAFRDTGTGFTLTVGPSVVRIQDYLFAGSSVTNVTFLDGLSPLTINGSAFRDCVRLTKVTLGSEVKYINESVFEGCSVLKTLIFNSNLETIGNYAFRGTAFTSMIIPDGIKTIGYASFQNCKDLTSVTMGKGLTSIGRDAFRGCTALQDVTYNATSATNNDIYNSSTDNGAFRDTGTGFTLTIGENVKDLLRYVFAGSSVKTVVTRENSTGEGMNSPILTIKDSAFRDCARLTAVTLGNTVLQIDDNAFYNCAVLTTISFNQGLNKIGQNAFNSSGVATINIPNSVTGIGYGAFYECKDLATLTLGTGLTSIGRNSFKGCTGLKNVTYNATNASNSDIYNNSTDNGAFRDTGAGFALTIGENVTNIQRYLFACSSVSSIFWSSPTTVISIRDRAFMNCTKLLEFKLPTYVTTIESYAFADNPALTICCFFDRSYRVMGVTYYSSISTQWNNGVGTVKYYGEWWD